ncbi:MAG TPA: glycolate oxidase subunit GlcE [Gammaproteobacteria bacterium]|nr:glycolate oxidase subunit GlcE [Gammaproteobacteria bacterium]
MYSNDATDSLIESVTDALQYKKPLWLRGGNSKSFFGNPSDTDCTELDLRCHAGVIDYVPDELVISVRAGTPLTEVVELLEQEGQMLPFEPPNFGGASTIGGVIASGLSGPRRPYTGAVRDFVLGVNLLSGNGSVLSFGGQVMKNVAGYDVSRLVVGAMGTLGVIMDVSLKVLPKRSPEVTWRVSEVPASIGNLSAHAIVNGQHYIRVPEGESLAGEVVDNDFWRQLATHELSSLKEGDALWRISVPPSSKQYLDEATVVEWGGALRWVADPKAHPHEVLESGHATLFRTTDDSERTRFQPLDPVVARIHEKLKHNFDPQEIFNPGRITWHAN